MEAGRDIVGMRNAWVKSHGLGNDYLVFVADRVDFELERETITRLCDRHYGIGSDGILLLVDSARADFGVRIFNPDGSEAEKSGNGLRILADYLYYFGFTQKKAFSVEVGGGTVGCAVGVDEAGRVVDVTVRMGRATFRCAQIPVRCDREEAVDVPIVIGGTAAVFSAVSVGNPHAVFLVDRVDPVEVCKNGPLVENNPLFPHRTNVQWAAVADRHNVRIEIWERGAGYTLASGSSSCAVAAVLHKKGLVDDPVRVHMPGGVLEVGVGPDYDLQLRGPVTRVACGVLL